MPLTAQATDLTFRCRNRTVTFDRDFRLGIEVIDRQHERIFRAALAFQRTLSVTSEWFLIASLILETQSALDEHLGYEEAQMQRAGHRDLVSHKQNHREFRQEIDQLTRDLERVKELPEQRKKKAEAMGGTLAKWLCQHILETDKNDLTFKPVAEVQERSPRYHFKARIILQLTNGQALTGRCENISASGVKLLITNPPTWLKDGELGRISCMASSELKEVPCRIVRCDEQGVALSFLSSQHHSLHEVIKKGGPLTASQE
ncbi:hemerythrin domain-containing protein [Magnetococcus sp. PR-3]|uniref:hemerythrin domain-containing protein n=1 Tax=Magnetococcus sp. PR-3 TaxID=3120355 RepID=UPI002FCE1B12